MKYLHFKDLIADIQKGALDPKTILIDVDWQEETLEVFNTNDETIWEGSTSSALLETLHHCLGVLTIHNMQTALLEVRSAATSQHPPQLWQSILDNMPAEEMFTSLVKAAEKQSQHVPDGLSVAC